MNPPFWNTIIPGCVIDVTDPKGNVAKDIATLNCIPAIFQLVLHFTFLFAGIAAVFFVLFAGIKFLTSGGDAKQVQGARQSLTYAIIGLIVILLSFAVINLISNVTGAGCILNFGLSVDICN